MAKIYWYPRPYGGLRLAAESVPDFLQKIAHIVPNAKAAAVMVSEGDQLTKVEGE